MADPDRDLYRSLVSLCRMTHYARVTLSYYARKVTGLTFEQVMALCVIDLNGGDGTVSTLAEALGRSSHTVTEMLNKLEQAGLATRRRDVARDQRQVRAALTEAGIEKLHAFRAAVPSFFPSMLNHPPDMEVARLQDAIATLERWLDH